MLFETSEFQRPGHQKHGDRHNAPFQPIRTLASDSNDFENQETTTINASNENKKPMFAELLHRQDIVISGTSIKAFIRTVVCPAAKPR